MYKVRYIAILLFITGKFGVVSKGWYTKNNKTIMIAVKTLQGYLNCDHCVIKKLLQINMHA